MDHPPSPFHTSRPKPSHNGSVSVFGPNPLPASRFASAPPHRPTTTISHNIVRTTPPPLPPHTIPHRRFTRRARNRATTARFRFLAQPPPCLAFRERTAPPPLPHRTHHPTTPMHHPPSPFHTARPKPSHNGSVSSFFSPDPLPASRFASARPHHHYHIVPTTPPPLCTIPRRHFTRRARNRATTARFRVFLAQTPSLPRVS
jgi:hypothetical protein